MIKRWSVANSHRQQPPQTAAALEQGRSANRTAAISRANYLIKRVEIANNRGKEWKFEEPFGKLETFKLKLLN